MPPAISHDVLCAGRDSLVLEQQPGQHAEHTGADRRQRAQQSFRIARFVPQPSRQIVKIDPVGEVGFGLVRAGTDPGHRHECQQRPIARQQRDNRANQTAPVEIEKQNRRKQIADGDTLQDADEAYVAQLLADTAIIDDAQHIQQKRTAQHVQMRFRPSLALDQPRQCEHNRNTRDENEQGEDEVVETEAFPVGMGYLCAEKFARGAERRAFAAQHPLKSDHRTVGANDPENAESAHRIDGQDTARLQCDRNICVAHRAPPIGCRGKQ